MSQNTDLLNKIIEDTPYHILVEKIYKDEAYREVYLANKATIFSEKTKRDFGCISSAEDIYLIVRGKPDVYEILCRRKWVETPPTPQTAGDYIKLAFSDLFKGKFIVTWWEKIPYAIRIFTNFHKIQGEVTDKLVWEEVIRHLATFDIIFEETRGDRTYPYFATMVDEFFSGVGRDLYNTARIKMRVDVSGITGRIQRMPVIDDEVRGTFHAVNELVADDDDFALMGFEE